MSSDTLLVLQLGIVLLVIIAVAVGSAAVDGEERDGAGR
jgi:hypothetical protein